MSRGSILVVGEAAPATRQGGALNGAWPSARLRWLAQDYPREVAVHWRMLAQATSSEVRGPQNIWPIAAWADLMASQRGPGTGLNAGSAESGRVASCLCAIMSPAKARASA